MTAPASWLVYDAMLDFVYLPEPGLLRLVPQFDGTFAVIHPLFWATGRRDGDLLQLDIVRVFSDQALAVRELQTSAEATGIEIDGAACEVRNSGAAYRSFAIEPVPLAPGATLTWHVAK